ncbi:hypothetical protein SAMN04488107_1397 [Geodermatophilus saharensis]|uniref:Uncharacterized protein n=1 Tax=Geodermatophilus saharensis TaxID=1137994 RepID=A0A239BTB4_9ACTN|nr:hypothetical protein [Geodermatophilus saharensis]SNS10658.1 hypothetical protein SAMN04488107_1397 [Geodermatophilus saharensis]
MNTYDTLVWAARAIEAATDPTAADLPEADRVQLLDYARRATVHGFDVALRDAQFWQALTLPSSKAKRRQRRVVSSRQHRALTDMVTHGLLQVLVQCGHQPPPDASEVVTDVRRSLDAAANSEVGNTSQAKENVKRLRDSLARLTPTDSPDRLQRALKRSWKPVVAIATAVVVPFAAIPAHLVEKAVEKPAVAVIADWLGTESGEAADDVAADVDDEGEEVPGVADVPQGHVPDRGVWLDVDALTAFLEDQQPDASEG